MKQQKQDTPVFRQCVTAFGIVLNVTGAFIAMSLKLPIYMDSIGTMLVACLSGPFYGGIAGLLGGITSGFLFDVYSFYFAPAQMVTGIMAGLLFHSRWMRGKMLPLGTFLVTLPCTVISALVTAVLFGGVTSSGSSILVMILSHMGIPLAAGVFITQIATDYADKMMAAFLAVTALAAMTNEMKVKCRR